VSAFSAFVTNQWVSEGGGERLWMSTFGVKDAHFVPKMLTKKEVVSAFE
jgi:hypothetical protein